MAVSTAISRSVRSARPTLPSSPRPSARARVYDTSRPPTRQMRDAQTSVSWSPSPANHRARPTKTAESETRSSVESRNAPHFEDRPDSRAIVPSRVSLKTNRKITSVPQNSSPRG